jgi:nucleotide-binding universal stress UspA family protein
MTKQTIDELGTFKNILVATDFQACSKRATQAGANLAKASGGQLFLHHTCELPAYGYPGLEFSAADWLTPIQEYAQRCLDEAVRTLSASGIRTSGSLGLGIPWEQILRAATRVDADVIVIGTHGRRGFSHAFLGSVAERVVRASPIPVLTIRGAAPDSEPRRDVP